MKPAVSTVLYALVFASLFGFPASSYASSAIQNVRAKIEAQAIRKTKEISSSVDTKLKSICNVYYQQINEIEKNYHCKSNCDEAIGEYNQNLYSQMDDMKKTLKKLTSGSELAKLKPSAILSICLRIAISEKNHKASYGIGQMLVHGDNYANRLSGGLWAFTSLALGKGVPRSKKAATDLVLKLTMSKEMDKKTKKMLKQLDFLLNKN